MSIPTTVVELRDPALERLIGTRTRIYTTLEGENPGGSVKDHMALGALIDMNQQGAFSKPGATLTEASAGSTARSLAYYCRELNIPFTVFVPDFLDSSAQNKLRELGAEVRAVPVPAGWDRFNEFCAQPHVIPFNQHGDPGKKRYYLELGRRVAQELGAVDAVLGAVGTGHSLLGAAEGISAGTRVITAEPLASEAVSGIRNLEIRHGDRDSCVPGLFHERIIVRPDEYFEGSQLSTSHGQIMFPDSFRVALGAAIQFLKTRSLETLFILGAANRRI